MVLEVALALLCAAVVIGVTGAELLASPSGSLLARWKAGADPRLFTLGLLSIVPGLVLIAVVQPHSPDLIAQLARAAMERTSEGATWWVSWYGGLLTPSYSVISPGLMGAAGVWVVGIIAAFLTVFASARLLVGQARPQLSIVLVSFALTANLASGRITFAVGVAFAALCLMFFTRQHPIAAAVLGALSWLGSPLAGLFLVLILACVGWTADRRRPAFMVAGVTGATGVALELLFPVSGHMPMSVPALFGLFGACGLIWLTKPHVIIRRTVVAVALATTALFVVGSPVGINMLRLPMLFAAAAIAATSALRARVMAPMVAVFCAWTIINCATDLHGGSDPSFAAGFYAPLLQQLPPAGQALNRIEVVDPVTHGPALYVAPVVPLARGWERQVDVTRNPIFYDNTLQPESYRAWLDANAVKWVAVPNTKLDYASKQEAALVATGLPYLQLTWSDADWKLYEVQDPTTLATGVGTVTQVGQSSLVLQSTQAGAGSIRVHWARGLTLVNVEDPNAHGTVIEAGDEVKYELPTAGTFVLTNQNPT